LSSGKRLKVWHWLIIIALLSIAIILAVVLTIGLYSVVHTNYMFWGSIMIGYFICIVVVFVIVFIRETKKQS
jgi:hypothetical protein